MRLRDPILDLKTLSSDNAVEGFIGAIFNGFHRPGKGTNLG